MPSGAIFGLSGLSRDIFSLLQSCPLSREELTGELARRGSPDPRYRKWIGAYGGEEFAAEVSEVLAVTDALGPELGTAERTAMHRHFRATSRYEWMFWDMGYREETWPL